VSTLPIVPTSGNQGYQSGQDRTACTAHIVHGRDHVRELARIMMALVTKLQLPFDVAFAIIA
jgi:hypothetical protein